MIRKNHKHRLQTNPQDREEDPQTPKVTREHDKTASFWIMYMDIVEIYLLFNRSCTIKGLKPRGGGPYI